MCHNETAIPNSMSVPLPLLTMSNKNSLLEVACDYHANQRGLSFCFRCYAHTPILSFLRLLISLLGGV